MWAHGFLQRLEELEELPFLLREPLIPMSQYQFDGVLAIKNQTSGSPPTLKGVQVNHFLKCHFKFFDF